MKAPDIWEVEDLYVSSISPEEVKLCISEIERDTSPGPDSITLADLKILTSHKIAAILNK